MRNETVATKESTTTTDSIVKYPEDGEHIKKDPAIDNEDKGINANTINDQPDEVDLDDLVASAGELGKYQIFLFFGTVPFYVFSVFVYYVQLFITQVSPNHWCWIPELENLTDIERRSLAIPQDSSTRFGYSHCQEYAANWSEVLLFGLKPNASWNTVSCQHGWEFNKSEIPYPTISSELGWVCDKGSYQANAQLCFFLGSIFGGIIFGWVADRFGRLPALVISNMVGFIAGVSSTFARSVIEFSICRFLLGMAFDNCYMMVYIIVLEYVAPKYRSLMSNLSFAIFSAFTLIALPWLALACGHWKVLSLVTSVPLATTILAILFLPESPRWLLSKGRIDDTIKKIQTIGRVNRKEIPTKLVEQFRLSANKNKEKEGESCLGILKRPTLRRVFILTCLEYMCCMLVIDGLIRCIGELDFDFFVSFSIMSFSEFPSMLFTAFAMDWLGRRWLSASTLAIACVFSVLSVFVSGKTSVMFVFISRLSVNMAIGCAIQWAAEILPTSVRGTGGSVVHISGFIAATLSPYIIYLGTFIHWLPLVIIGCISGFGAITALMLPETAKKEMPQTFEESEEMIRSQKFWEFPCIKKDEVSNGEVNDSFEM